MIGKGYMATGNGGRGNGMWELIKQGLELGAQTRCLKRIAKECDKRERLLEKARLQVHIINAMINQYDEIYGENLKEVLGRKQK